MAEGYASWASKEDKALLNAPMEGDGSSSSSSSSCSGESAPPPLLPHTEQVPSEQEQSGGLASENEDNGEDDERYHLSIYDEEVGPAAMYVVANGLEEVEEEGNCTCCCFTKCCVNAADFVHSWFADPCVCARVG